MAVATQEASTSAHEAAFCRYTPFASELPHSPACPDTHGRTRIIELALGNHELLAAPEAQGRELAKHERIGELAPSKGIACRLAGSENSI